MTQSINDRIAEMENLVISIAEKGLQEIQKEVVETRKSNQSIGAKNAGDALKSLADGLDAFHNAMKSMKESK